VISGAYRALVIPSDNVGLAVENEGFTKVASGVYKY